MPLRQIRYDARVINCDDLLACVRTFAAARTPALDARRAVIAVSGGGDSIATAALLCEARILDPSVSIVAHFDHRLRDAAAAQRDRAAVEALCARYGLTLVAEAWSDPHAGEAAARDARYRFLARVAADSGIGVVVTGHTSDDQVETVIMHTLRGAGLHGLRGMSPESSWPVVESSQFTVHSSQFAVRDKVPALRLARPMLCVSRSETRAYCAARALAFADDASNDDTSLLRNRVRLELLPQIEAMAPGARASILRLADEAHSSVAAFEALAIVALGGESGANVGTVRISRDTLRALPPAVLPYAWRLAIERVLGDARDFNRRHYAVMAAAAGARTGATFELPRGVRLTVDADAIVLSIGALGWAAIDASVEHDVPFVGAMGAWSISVVAGACGDRAGTSDDGDHVWVARGLGMAPGQWQQDVVLPAGAVVRGRRPGDRLQPIGMQGHKKLQDYYIDRKIPHRDRDAAPVIAAGRDVLWTPFGACAPATSGQVHALSCKRISSSRARA